MRKTQSILEYVIILAAITAAVIAAAQGPVRQAVTNMFNDASQVITNTTTDFRARAAH